MEANYFTVLCWFCHTSTWIHHGCTHVPHPEPPSHLPPCTIPLGHPSAPAPSILYPASNLDWRFVSYMILYIFQCHSPKSSHLHHERGQAQCGLSQNPEIIVPQRKCYEGGHGAWTSVMGQQVWCSPGAYIRLPLGCLLLLLLSHFSRVWLCVTP